MKLIFKAVIVPFWFFLLIVGSATAMAIILPITIILWLLVPLQLEKRQEVISFGVYVVCFVCILLPLYLMVGDYVCLSDDVSYISGYFKHREEVSQERA